MNSIVNILLIIYAVFFVLVALTAMYLGFRYNLHMFQLNGYKNLEHIKRMAPGIGRQWLLLLMIPLGALRELPHGAGVQPRADGFLCSSRWYRYRIFS